MNNFIHFNKLEFTVWTNMLDLVYICCTFIHWDNVNKLCSYYNKMTRFFRKSMIFMFVIKV